MAYEPTGYPRGRPRKGEIRPPSPNAIKMAEYRSRRLERDPGWYKVLAEQQREWRKNNLERSKEIERGTRTRAKAWGKLEKKAAVGRHIALAQRAADLGPPKKESRA